MAMDPDRRTLLSAGISLTFVAASMIAPASARRKREDGKTFVLVHGAWQSSFCWEQVTPLWWRLDTR